MKMLEMKECFFLLLLLLLYESPKQHPKEEINQSILAGHFAAQVKTETKLNTYTYFPKRPVPPSSLPSPQALPTLDDQIMARHVVRGFGGQINDGSLQVGHPSQPPGGDVRQPAPHQRLQVLGADERRVHDAPATSTGAERLAPAFPREERQHLEAFKMAILKKTVE